MKYVQIEMLSETINCPVVYVPGRKFPGVVIQGDSLKILLGHAQEIEELAAQCKNKELNIAVASLKLILSDYVEEYEVTMKANGRDLPYPKAN